jgi:glutathione synthase/RimK-type ligase-like ATP-grasp enzyme
MTKAMPKDSIELLIVGGESDPNTRRVADQAAIRGIDSFVADTDIAASREISWSFDEPVVSIGGFDMEPSAIFMRQNVFRPTPQTTYMGLREYAAAWPQVRILNRQTMGAQNSKSGNLRLAGEFGFAVPKSFIVDGVAALPVPNTQDWVTKPLLGGHHTIPADELEAAVRSGERTGLHFIQHRLDGANIRVFVIGGKTFTFEITTDLLDYRENNDCGVLFIETPEVLERPCIEMAAHIGFSYCAFDFRGVKSDDDLQFLEVNSFPMFARFDSESENRLVDQILTVLLGREITEANR